jgi:hypothetical protein
MSVYRYIHHWITEDSKGRESFFPRTAAYPITDGSTNTFADEEELRQAIIYLFHVLGHWELLLGLPVQDFSTKLIKISRNFRPGENAPPHQLLVGTSVICRI